MEDKPASLLVVSLAKKLSGIPHVRPADRWTIVKHSVAVYSDTALI